MNGLSPHKQVLIDRLENLGMNKGIIFGFILSLKSFFLDNPNMDHLQINNRLKDAGWGDFKLDDHTLRMAIACFRAEGIDKTQPFHRTTGNPFLHDFESVDKSNWH